MRTFVKYGVVPGRARGLNDLASLRLVRRKMLHIFFIASRTARPSTHASATLSRSRVENFKFSKVDLAKESDKEWAVQGKNAASAPKRIVSAPLQL